MWWKRKKILIISAFGLVLTPTLIAVSCSPNIVNELGQNKIIIDNKTVKYTAMNLAWASITMNSSIYKNIVTKPISINNFEKMSEFLKDWKNKLLEREKNIDIDNIKNLTEIINELEKQIKEYYSKEWFNKNTLIIDFGCYIDAKIVTDNSDFWIKNNVVKNLKNIEINKDKLTLVYDHSEVDKKNSGSWIRYYPVFYEINNNEFNLNKNYNYKVEKITTTTTRKILIENRKYNAGSYFNFVTHSLDGNETSGWKFAQDLTLKKTYSEWFRKRIGTILVKTYEKFKELFNFNLNSTPVVKSAFLEFNEEFFKDNVLNLISVNEWANNFTSGDQFIQDYNASIDNNNLNITLYRTGLVSNDRIKKKIPRYIKNKTIWDYTKILLPESDDVTLFIPLKKSEFENYKTADVNISVVDSNFYSE
ncbi:hypothetical protein ACA758_01755 [Mycoplasmopsis agassizii]|uniref:hypothetical protein n=1 Tax=Mycoplasmopsis agassizii TaxID=33922 RepID=UPI003528A75E